MQPPRILLSTLSLLGSASSFVAHTLFLRAFGAGGDVDILFYALSGPLSLSGIATGVLVYFLPPLLLRESPQSQLVVVRSICSTVYICAGVCVLFAVLTSVWGGDFKFWTLWGVASVLAALLVAANAYASLAQARGQYVRAAGVALLPSTGLLLGAALSQLTGVLLYLLVGQLLGVVCAILQIALSSGIQYTRFRGREFRYAAQVFMPMRRDLAWISVGTLAFTLFSAMDALLCARIGEGAVTVMSFAQRVVVAGSAVISMGSYYYAAKTSHSTIEMKGRSALIPVAFEESLRIVTVGLFVWMLYVIVGAKMLLFLLGDSNFTADRIAMLIDVGFWMLLGLGPMAAMPYLYRVFYALGSYRSPALIGCFVVVMYYLLSSSRLAVSGLSALGQAYAMTWWLCLVGSLFLLKFTVIDYSKRV